MRFPLKTTLKIASHIIKHKVLHTPRFAMVLQLEPLHTCNLACTGCGGIGATHSVSPASFFIPGLVENTPNSSFEEYRSHTQTGKSISDTQLEFFSSDNLKVICSNPE